MYAQARTKAFTLTELLVAMAIIALLAAILFPAFAAVRRSARQVVCISNEHQIGMAIRMYSQDYDDIYPWAVDPSDKYTPQIWGPFPDFQDEIPFMPLLQDALQPYIKSLQLFHCPADTGYTVEDFTGFHLDALPTSFKRFGTSYNYRTELAFIRASDATFADPAGVNVLMDAGGQWHGGWPKDTRRYNVLHGDGHTKNLTRAQLELLWQSPL